MVNYRAALNLLCDTVIKFASPYRGVPPKNVHERRDARPTHFPPFLDQIAVAKCKLEAVNLPDLGLSKLSEQDCASIIEHLLELIFEEAQRRNPHVPAYFEDALDFCFVIKPVFASVWLNDVLKTRAEWNDLFVDKFERLVKVLSAEHQLTHTV